MRQTSHWSWDYYRAKAYTDEAMGTAFENYTSEEQLETHFSEYLGMMLASLDTSLTFSAHCLDIIRQEIMCTANTGIYGQWFVKDVGLVMDFSFNRQCKNFDAIREWYANNHVDMDNTYVRKRPGDVVFDEPL